MSGRLSCGGRLAVVVPAAAALLAVALAGCNPVASSAAAGNGGEAAAATTAVAAANSPAASPPAQTSAAAQRNSEFPYEPDGVSISNDAGAGGVYTFSLPAGAYSQNTTASYDPALDPDDSGQCLFSGEFDIATSSGWSLIGPLGVTVPITTGIYGPAIEVNLAAGDYKVYIYPETTCSWTFTLAP